MFINIDIETLITSIYQQQFIYTCNINMILLSNTGIHVSLTSIILFNTNFTSVLARIFINIDFTILTSI